MSRARLWLNPVWAALLACAACGFGLAQAETVSVRARMEPQHLEFLKTHCADCHNADEANGQVRLDDIPLEIGDIPSAERWQKVLGVLNSGEMPPDDSAQPPDADKASFLEVLSKQIVIARKALADTGGAITMRRLNRREYVNTIRELLDVEVNARDLPADDDEGAKRGRSSFELRSNEMSCVPFSLLPVGSHAKCKMVLHESTNDGFTMDVSL
jgi:hypothetical protein